MRTKTIIPGLKNSQKIRVIVNGVGFETTVEGMTRMTFAEQKIAIWTGLEKIAREKLLGFASTTTFYDSKLAQQKVDFQVNIL